MRTRARGTGAVALVDAAVRTVRVDVCSGTMLDRQFISIFLPLHYISTGLFNRKYNLNINVTSTKITEAFYAMLGISIKICMLISISEPSVNSFSCRPIYSMYISLYLQDTITYSLVLLLSLYHNKSFKRILTKLQSIDLHLPSRSKNIGLKKIVWISYITLVLIYGTFITWKFISKVWTWQKACFHFLDITNDAKLIQFTAIVYFIANKMKEWIRLLNSRNLGQNIQRRTRNDSLEIMFADYRDLLKALDLVDRSTQCTVFLCFVLSFGRILYFVQILITQISTEHMDPELIMSSLVSISLFVTKTIALGTVYCAACDHLYRQVNRAQVAVILFGSRQEHNAVRRFVRNICRYSELHFNKLSCWGMFELNAKLPLHLTAATVSYVVVLLQFAFL